MSEDFSMSKAVFFPYYVNQHRLLDVFAILNGGFTEYEELQAEESRSVKKGISANAEAGFRLFRLGGGGSFEREHCDSDESRSSMRRVHTTTSMLKAVLQQLDERGYLREIEASQAGDFVVVPVRFCINSIKAVIDEAIELAKLGDKFNNLDVKPGAKRFKTDVSALERVNSAVRELFGSEEMVSESKGYAVISSIDDVNLYQSDRHNVVGVDMLCLGQIRAVHDKGAQLLRNTVFVKIKDSEAKSQVIESLLELTKNAGYRFDNDVIPEIIEKPVYELEIVALYQDTYPLDVGAKTA